MNEISTMNNAGSKTHFLRENIPRGINRTRVSSGFVRVKRVEDKIEQFIEHVQPCAGARWLLRQKSFRVFDTETTGIEDDSRIVSIAVIDRTGQVLVDTLVNPLEPIPSEATAIHGITDDDVRDAPTFRQIYGDVRRALNNQVWAVYNVQFDRDRVHYECMRNNLPNILPYMTDYRSEYAFRYTEHQTTYCAMNAFARHFGQYHDYFNNYTWKKLTRALAYYGLQPTDTHTALGDAIDTLTLINQMALDEDIERKQ